MIKGGLAALMLGFSLNLKAETNQAVSASAELRAVATELSQYILPTQLDFKRFLTDLVQQPKSTNLNLNSWFQSLNRLKDKELPACSRIEFDNTLFQLNLLKQRHTLMKGKAIAPEYPRGFYRMEDGQLWYQHWLNSWLQMEVGITDLQQMAERELKAAVALRQQARENKKGQISSKMSQYQASKHTQIVAEFRSREKQVKTKLMTMFGTELPVANLSIRASNLPKSFPAPGIYNPQTRTFLYHLQTDVLPAEQMDWLFLHEGVPGHHFQSQQAAMMNLCPNSTLAMSSTLMAEGWGAYVETLGAQLGLFQHPDSELYALQWRILRAVRVLMDVGIHFEGWSDTDAEGVWNRYLPNEQTLFQRELNRIKDWPVQSITYVFGKSLIEKSIDKTKQQNSAVTLPQLHKTILALSANSPVALNYLTDFLQ